MRRRLSPARWRWRQPASVSRWIAAILGTACVALGLVIIIRPLMSLDTLTLTIAAGFVGSGLIDLMKAMPAHPGRAVDAIVAAAWIAAGVVVASWPGLTLRTLVWLVGLGLIAAGISRGARAIRARVAGPDRLAEFLLGVASAMTGVLALVWPDVSLLVIAVIFGARTLWFGAVNVWASVRPRRYAATVDTAGAPAWRRRRKRWLPAAVSVVAVLAASAGAATSGWIHSSTPTVDAFYSAPSPAPGTPGTLIRSEPFTRGVPNGATGWRILYSTTNESGQIRTASAVVVAPRDDATHPVIAWAHGTTGFARPCAPSLAAQPFESGALFLLDTVIEHGWALVATDYAGLGTTGPQPYLIGQGEARSVLDAIRAARQIRATQLSDRTVVWGHSQGGHAALWTGQIATDYAPDVPLAGVAALAPASNLTAFAGELATMTGGSVFGSYVISAYSQTYPDVSFTQYVRPAARVVVQRMATRCLAEPGILVSVLSALSLAKDPAIWSENPTTGPLGQRLSQNVPTGPFSAPVLIAQGGSDSLAPPAMQQRFVAGLCASGNIIDYRTYAGRDHISLVQPSSPLVGDLVAWTEARLAGRPAASSCSGD